MAAVDTYQVDQSQKSGLLTDYAVNPTEPTCDLRTAYKVYIPEMEPSPAPTSQTDPILWFYPNIFPNIALQMDQMFSPGDLVRVEYRDMQNLIEPTIVSKEGHIPLALPSTTPEGLAFKFKQSAPVMSDGGEVFSGNTSVPAFSYSALKSLWPALEPLLDYISVHESGGKYEALNRGVGGDTPGYAKGIAAIGKDITSMTVGEVLSYMKGGSKAADTGVGGKTDKVPNGSVGFLATGKYQMIPKTLRAAVRSTGIPLDTVYNQETQETLGVYLLLKKRATLGSYLIGSHNNEREAAQSAALEWASLPLQYGRSNGCKRGFSAYCKGGANSTRKLGRSPEEVIEKLRAARESVSNNSVAQSIIGTSGGDSTA